MWQLASVPVLSDVIVIFWSWIVVISLIGKFWVVPVLRSVGDMLGVFCLRWYERVIMDGEVNILGFEERVWGLFQLTILQWEIHGNLNGASPKHVTETVSFGLLTL
jgi:hypothetical protein